MRWPCSALCAMTAVVLAAGPSSAQEPQAMYESTFGQEAKKVSASYDKRDDAALASKLLAAAKDAPDSPEYQVLLLTKAHDFGLRHEEGYPAAEESLELLAQVVPQRRRECRGKLLELDELRHRYAQGDRKATAARIWTARLVAAGNEDLLAGRSAEALELYRRAGVLARQNGWSDAAEIGAKAEMAAAQEKADRQIETLTKTLQANPEDRATARKILMAHLTERDDPNQTARLLAVAETDESLRSYVPLAVKAWMDLNETQCLELGRWYQWLSGQASPAARPRMLHRARAYYEAHLTLRDKDDAASVPAKFAVLKLTRQLEHIGTVPGGFVGPPKGVSAAMLPWIRQRDELPVSTLLTELKGKLSEVNGGKEIRIASQDVKGGVLTRLDLIGNSDLRCLGPLYGMPLRSLSLHATGISTLACLRGMKLEFLDVGGCGELGSLEGLEGAPLKTLLASGTLIAALEPLRGAKLIRLNLGGCGRLKGLTGLEGMPLTELRIPSCSSVASLEPVRGAPLRRLDLSNCSAIGGLDVLRGMRLEELMAGGYETLSSLEILRGMPLRILALNGCRRVKDISPLTGMPLEDLDLASVPLTSLLPLKGMPLRRLNLQGCSSLKSLEGVEALPLTWLRLAGTRFANDDVAAELKKRIRTLEAVDLK